MIVAVPASVPLTLPDPSMGAVPVALLLQVPPPSVSVSVVDDPLQTFVAPLIADGKALTVITLVMIQPEDTV